MGKVSSEPNGVRGILLRFAINAIALSAAARIIPGIRIDGWEVLLVTALLFGVVNAFIRPLVSCVTCLVQIITLGAFTLVLNAAMLWLTSWLAQELGLGFYVESFKDAFLGALLVSLVSFILTRFIK